MASTGQKAKATKRMKETVWQGKKHWTVRFGELARGRGRPSKIRPLFLAVGEKLPFEAIDKVRKHLISNKIPQRGVYIAHDSMGTPRYIGRGDIFGRLKTHHKTHIHELLYFSFFVVQDRMHEREVETLLIRAAGASLFFNDRKKRVDIAPGNVADYEAGTLFYERQHRKGRKKS